MISENIIYIDIETVSQKKSFSELNSNFQAIWKKKWENSTILQQISLEDSYEQKAAIFAEYSKIICISVAYYHTKNNEYRLTSFYDHDELNVLSQFKSFIEKLSKKYIFCGHNIKEFDIPFICRRFLINNIKIPSLLNFQDKKPWEIEMIDTLQFWRFGDFKNFTSLETLTTIFDIPSPKADIDGSQVGHTYWVKNDIEKIAIYCQNDVVAMIQLHQKLNQKPMIDAEKITIIDSKMKINSAELIGFIPLSEYINLLNKIVESPESNTYGDKMYPYIYSGVEAYQAIKSNLSISKKFSTKYPKQQHKPLDLLLSRGA